MFLVAVISEFSNTMWTKFIFRHVTAI